MSAVYKSLSSNSTAKERRNPSSKATQSNGEISESEKLEKKYRQKVLMLTSRGVSYR